MSLSFTSRVLTTALLLSGASAALADGVVKQTSNVIGQSLQPGTCTVAPRPTVSPNGASLIRTSGGITASVSMPTPAPGSYCYPPANGFQTVAPTPGTPEVFTGWFFFFNHPEKCRTPHACVPPPPGAPPPNDFSDASGGVYNFAGHAVSGGGTLSMIGHIEVGEASFGGNVLLNPMGAEVHLAIAPHGVVVPSLLPDQINTPVGGPPFWWVGLFGAP